MSLPKLHVEPSLLAVCRLAPHEALPHWALASPFFSLTKTMDELSVVCLQASVPSGITCEGEWRALKVEGPLDFGLTGILSAIATPLAEAKISIFAISTYDTDYVLVKSKKLTQAVATLEQSGFHISE